MAKETGRVVEGNKENDKILRQGLSNLYAIEKEKARKKEMLNDPETKEKLVQWLFSGADNKEPSPLA